jgi:hypothetical protein
MQNSVLARSDIGHPPNSVDPTGMTLYHYAFAGEGQL